MSEAPDLTEGHLLGGRVRYAQPRAGFRSGIEPVFLAAAIPARAGQTVLEAGTGAGAAALCLAFRIPGVAVTAVERDPAMARLARRNVAANAFAVGPVIVEGDITAAPPGGPFDHACANPPWHDRDATASPIAARDAAKRAAPGLVAAWACALASSLRPRGTLTLIMPAAALSASVAALAASGCGAMSLIPLWPRPGVPARIVLLQAIRGSAGPDRVLPGLVLHESAGGYTAAAEAVLREGLPLTPA